MTGSEQVDRLLEEFIERHLRGELPDPIAYVDRAGVNGAELRELIALFLAETEPVTPSDQAAGELARRHGKVTPVGEWIDASERAGAGRSEPEWHSAWRDVLETWISATLPQRHELVDRVSLFTPVLHLKTASVRSRSPAVDSPITRIHLNHPAGARVEIDVEGLLTLIVIGLPDHFVGSLPIVAFPAAAQASEIELDWFGRRRGLPDGIAQAEREIDQRAELRLTVGRLQGGRSKVGSLLADVCVIDVPEDVA